MNEAETLRALLKALCDAVGELPAVETDQATKKAYSAATNYLEPDAFTERFMAKHREAA